MSDTPYHPLNLQHSPPLQGGAGGVALQGNHVSRAHLALTLLALYATHLEAHAGEKNHQRRHTASAAPYQLQPGVFPPEGAGRSLAGELIEIDHVNRQGVLRVDRSDSQTRGEWDHPLPFALLPYGVVMFQGAPAALRDIPLGTHLHAEFFIGLPVERFRHAYERTPRRTSPYIAYSRVGRLEDDFSHAQRLGEKWRVTEVDSATGTLRVSRSGAAETDASKPIGFAFGPDTRVWQGRGIGQLAELTPDQEVLLNLTQCTLKGPGRCTDIWLDDLSCATASAHQLERHRRDQREHGLAGWVDAVDNSAGLVSVTLFGGIDAGLLDDFLKADVFRAAVAEDSLRTYDPVNDKKQGPGSARRVSSGTPWDSGVQVTFRPSELLEGFRPKRIVRVWPGDQKAGGWKIDYFPREELLYTD